MPGHKRFSAKVAAPARLAANKSGVATTQLETAEEAAEATNALATEVQFAKVKDNPAALKSPLTPQNILRLQNTLGNQAVQRLITGKPQTAQSSTIPAQPIQRMRFDVLPQKSIAMSDAIAKREIAPGNKGSSKIIMFKVDRKLHFSIVSMRKPEFNEFHVTIITEIEVDKIRTPIPSHYFFREDPPGVWTYRDSSDEKANLEYPDLFAAQLAKGLREGAKFAAALSALNNPAAAAAAGKAADNGPSAAAAAAAATHSPAAGAAGGGAGGYYNPPSAAAAKYVPIQPSPAPMGTYSPPPANGPAAPMAASNSSNSGSATASATATASPAPALEPAIPVIDVSPTAAAAAAAASATTDSISAEAPAPAPAAPAAVLPMVDKVLDGQAANPNQPITPQAASSAMAAASLPANAVAELDRQLAQARSQQVRADLGSAAAPASPHAAPITLRKFLVLLAVVALVLAIVSKKDIENWLEKFLTPVNND